MDELISLGGRRSRECLYSSNKYYSMYVPVPNHSFDLLVIEIKTVAFLCDNLQKLIIRSCYGIQPFFYFNANVDILNNAANGISFKRLFLILGYAYK